MESDDTIEKAVIVGGGLAGLTAAYELKRAGIAARIFDKDDKIGQTWLDRHPQLSLNTHRSVSHLPHLQYPRGTPAFPRRTDVAVHLQEFARRHDLSVEHGVTVSDIRRTDDCFTMQINAASVRARNVVIATGRDRYPVMPILQGGDGYRGLLIHSSQFGDAKQYEGKRVLVIGGGNSGFDVLNHLSRVRPAQTWVSVRSGSTILPKRLHGIAVHRLSPLVAALPSKVADVSIALTQFLAFGSLADTGLPAAHKGAATRLSNEQIAIPVDDGAIRSIRDGRTKVVSEVLGFSGDMVSLADGTSIDPEIIIAATGYGAGLGSLIPALDGTEGVSIRQSNAYEGLWFVGMTPGLISYFHNVRRESRQIAIAIRARRYRQFT